MAADLENLREQAQNLESCLARLRTSADAFPDPKEARWLETLMESSLLALRSHIKELEKLEYRPSHQNVMFPRKRD